MKTLDILCYAFSVAACISGGIAVFMAASGDMFYIGVGLYFIGRGLRIARDIPKGGKDEERTVQ